MARQFGGAKALAERGLQDIRKYEAAAEDWWWFCTAEVGAPKRSAADAYQRTTDWHRRSPEAKTAAE